MSAYSFEPTRWGYRVSSLCPLCNSPSPTTTHIINGCQEALKEDTLGDKTQCSTASLLWSLRKFLLTQKLDADLHGLRANEFSPATLPTNLSTSARPDIVIVSENNVTMIEQTIPSESRGAMMKDKEKKNNKPNYNSLIGDLEDCGLSVNYRTLEIGSLGHYLSDAVFCISLISTSQIRNKTSS